MDYQFDIDELEQDVTEVLRYSQNFYDDDLEGVKKIMEQWLAGKSRFIQHMQGKLIYQLKEPVSFELDDNAKKENLERFAEQVDSHYNNESLSCFLYSVKITDFYENKTSMEYNIPDRYGKTQTVPKNFKVVKAFKFFEEDAEKLKQLQSEASRIIQENVISGYLCFSVHPLDYLSVSENVHNWRSCHALDGEYRSGNLNYMVDDTTVVCYLRADKQAILPHFPYTIPWNSKKWIVLLCFANDKTIVFAGRQYPFFASKGTDLIASKILPALGFGRWSNWNNTLIKTHKDGMSGTGFYFKKSLMPIDRTLKPLSNIVFDGPNTYQFNDLIRSTCYTPMWSYLLSNKDEYWWDTDGTGLTGPNTKVQVGKYCPCPVCGGGVVSYTDMMTCPSCGQKYNYEDDDYFECEICGSMTYCDDLYDLEYSGLRVCPECFNRETSRCQECGISDMPDQVKYHDGDDRCLCPRCWEDRQRQLKKFPRIIF